MAAATAANVNGLSGDAAAASSTPVAPTSPSGSNGSESNGNGAASTKRKRDASSDGDEVMADTGAPQPAATTATAPPAAAASASASASPAFSSKLINGKTEAASNGIRATPGPVTSTTAGNRDEKRLIRDYFDVLQTYANAFSQTCFSLIIFFDAPAY